MRPLSCLVLALILSGCATKYRPYRFALIGDTPYTPVQITNEFPNMIRALNREKLAFVVHVGDIKGGSSPCTDETFTNRLHDFQSIKHPFVLLFGDNEWTDCGKATKDPRDPNERLAKLRELFASGDKSLGGRNVRITRQSEIPEYSAYPENVRWLAGDALFVGLNVPGTSNNHGKPEFAARNEANIAWLKSSFEIARRKRCRGVMVMWQANPFPERGSTNRMHAGFAPMMKELETLTLDFGKPVVLVHGDSHFFRIDKPLSGSTSKRRIENLTRVETFGDPDNHWLCVTVDSRDPQLFTVRQRIVEANRVNHRPQPR